MGSDQLIELLSQVSTKLIPVAIFILLIYLILFFKHLVEDIKTLNTTLSKANKAIDTANEQLRKLDKPLATAENLSETVDMVHESAKSAVRSTIAIVLDNLDNIKSKLAGKKNSNVSDEPDIVESSEQASE